MTAPFKDFLCSYQHDGKQFNIDVRATSWGDALAHLSAIGATGKVEGPLHPTHPTTQIAPDWFGRFYTWLRGER